MVYGHSPIAQIKLWSFALLFRGTLKLDASFSKALSTRVCNSAYGSRPNTLLDLPSKNYVCLIIECQLEGKPKPEVACLITKPVINTPQEKQNSRHLQTRINVAGLVDRCCCSSLITSTELNLM